MNRFFLLSIIFSIFPLSLYAGSVFLNGVKIDHIKNQKFKSVDVEIDNEGNIYIIGKDYEVYEETISPFKKELKKVLNDTYYIVSEESHKGLTKYVIEVYINNNKVKTIVSGEPQTVMDITNFLVPGDNKVVVKSIKEKGSAPGDKNHSMYIYIGKGLKEGNNIVIRNPQIIIKRDASETEDFEEMKILKVE